MEYSKYQLDIFEYIKKGQGNLVVSAKAGSGKTSTILKSLEYIKPNQKVLFVAFNKSIADELKTKIDNPQVKVMTLHGLGYSLLRNHFNEQKIVIDEFKYTRYLNDNIHKLSSLILEDLTPKEYDKYINNIIGLCNLGRSNMVYDYDSMGEIVVKYGYTLISDEHKVAMEMIWWGEDNTNVIDFTDMVYLPLVLRVKPLKYDIVYIDECQDLSNSQRELVLKSIKQGGRFIAVGDFYQIINGFAGSNEESFTKLQSQPYTKTLPLSVCYRCPSEVIRFVKKLIPDIEASPTSKKGEVKFKCTLDEIKDGDMVLCRNTSPLIYLYYELINNDKKAFIKGSEFHDTLLSLIKNTNKTTIDVCKINDNGIMEVLFKQLIKQVEEQKNKLNISEADALMLPKINMLFDNIKTIMVLGKGVSTLDELVLKFETVFKEDETGICLCTIHKSKGLENDDVYILAPELIPSKSATLEWEIQQENNLMYVAYTRAKNKLGFIAKGEVKYGVNTNDNLELTNIYNKIKNNLQI